MQAKREKCWRAGKLKGDLVDAGKAIGGEGRIGALYESRPSRVEVAGLGDAIPLRRNDARGGL